MADNKSCEVESVKEKQRKIDNLFGPSKSKTNLSVKMDFSESLKSLKAIQREARKATAALKEYDNVVKHTCPECKTISLDLNILTADTQLYQTHRHCYHCGYKDVLEYD